MFDEEAVMEAGGAPAATPEPGAEEASLPEHSSPPAADLFPFTTSAPAVVVVTVDAPAGAEAEAAAPGGKPVVFSPSKGGKSVATFAPKHVEVRARCRAARSCGGVAARRPRGGCCGACAASQRLVGTRKDLC